MVYLFSCWEGECINGECQCPDGFLGDYCEKPGTTCGENFCYNGNCTESLTCLCERGFSGNFCEIDQCDLIHCGKFGVCLQGSCQCRFPSYGEFCQYEDTGMEDIPEFSSFTNLFPSIFLTLIALFSFWE